jgi:hypothetical protein
VVTFSGEAADTSNVWWLWVVGGLAAWIVVAFLLSVIVGRSIRLADHRSPGTGQSAVLTTADLEPAIAPPAAARVRRQALPLPALGIGLIVVVLSLETCGYLIRLTGGEDGAARLLSMDATFSLPRMFVGLLFAAAAAAAVAGAGSLPGRRMWWLAVALVGGGIAGVKAGGTVHSRALHALGNAIGDTAALVVSAVAAVAVVGALAFLSRSERRDRRRVLGVLAGYAAASVGLSALSAVVAGAYGSGSTWAATATYVEESAEALAAVAFLLAVLAGVAPRLVLPTTWPLRRSDDALTLDLPEGLPGRPFTERGDA